MPNANDLNKKLAIWKYYKTVNEAGTPKEDFIFYKYTYGSLKVLSGNFGMTDPPGELSETQVEIIVRYDKEIDYKCEFQYTTNKTLTQRYKIKYIEDIGGNFYKIICTLFNEYN